MENYWNCKSVKLKQSHQVPLMFVVYFFKMLHGHHTQMKIDHGLGSVLLTKNIKFSSLVKRVKSVGKAIKVCFVFLQHASWSTHPIENCPCFGLSAVG